MRGTLDPKDAAFALSTREGLPTDQYFLLAFDGAPSFAAVREQVGARAASVPALGKRLVRCPGNIDYPVWVAATIPESTACQPVPGVDRSWARCLDAMAEICSHPLDAEHTPWQLHIATPVAAVPGAGSEATVVLVRFSHALTDGGGGAALVRALFGRRVDPQDTIVAAAAAPSSTGRARILAAGAARTAARAVRLLPALAAALISARRLESPPQRGEPLVFNDRCTNRRRLAVLPVPPRTGGTDLTRTELALTAISVAMENYARERNQDPRSLTAHVTVAVPDGAAWQGENAFLPAVVPLAPDTSVRERAMSIRSSLRSERHRLRDARTIRAFRLAESVPLPLFRLVGSLSTRGVNPGVHTSFTSLRCGDGEMSIGDAPLTLIAGFPTLAERVSIGHGLYSAGDLLTLSVLACPAAVDLDHYRHLLERALTDVHRLRGIARGSVRFA